MSHPLKNFYGQRLVATDGEIGHVKDFYFDDQAWEIRYAVADTGTWLPGRMVLLSRHAFAHFHHDGAGLPVNLTRKQIEDSPSIETHRPVSRQYETEYYRYYGWPVYWMGDGYGGLGGSPGVLPVLSDEAREHHGHQQRDDAHLQSAQAIDGYRIQTEDGLIGEVTGLTVDDKTWAIRALTVETGHWYHGKEILIAPAKIKRISYEESTVWVNLTKADIEQTQDHEIAVAAR
jgi:hypothetical protein